MRVLIVTPAPPRSTKGNRITADRWARILRSLHHRVTVATSLVDGRFDLLLALHARKSGSAIRRFRRRFPDRPIILALTGTDLYKDIRTSQRAQESLAAADRLIVLQPAGAAALPARFRPKTRVILQSVAPRAARPKSARAKTFDVCLLGHLRSVKDPFRTALAARHLAPDSRIRVLHLGAALTESYARRARREEAINPRYHWLGGVPRAKAMRLLASCRVLVLSSRMEGGANVIGEAIVHRVPVLSSHIPGSVGLLGEDYSGYFRFRDTAALAALLRRAEKDAAFLGDLRRRCAALAPLFRPAAERVAWRGLLREIRAS
ncbi:MAG: selenoneine biosynthesis selenosugar synthase SenB [Planctomycetota bacterium]